MKLFDASKAKALVSKAKKQEMNYQRQFVLDRIQDKASTGETSIVLDYSDIHLLEEDYEFFEKLSYKVTREKVKLKKYGSVSYQVVEFGTVSWD